MAGDRKTTQLTENTTPLSSDLLYMVDDPAGSPVSQKVSLDNAQKAFVSGNDGDIQFNSGDKLASDSGFKFDEALDNLGVGQSTPTARIHIGASDGSASSAPIKIDSGTLLSTPETGTIEYSNNRTYITNVNTQKAIDRTSDVITSTSTVSNTTTETTIFTASIPPSSGKAGNVLEVTTLGVITSASASDVVTFRFKVGGNTLATLTSPSSVLSDDVWFIKGFGTVRTEGTTGSAAMATEMTIGDVSDSSCVVSAVDTTADNSVTITVQWDAAKAGNSVSIFQGHMEYKN